MQRLHRGNEEGVGDADDRLDAAGEAVFEQGSAENRDQALPMARGHARRGHEEAGELIDVVALRQSRAGPNAENDRGTDDPRLSATA